MTPDERGDDRLVTILDGLPVAVMLRAADGTLLHLNPGAERWIERLGVGVSAVRDSPRSLLDHLEVVDEEGRPVTPDMLPVVSSIRDTRDHDATLGFALPDGGYAWYSVRAVPVELGDGTTGTVVTLDDVTERHEERRRSAITERSLRSTFDHAPIGIAVLSPVGRVLRVNGALCELLGHDAEELLTDGLHPALHPDERDADGEPVSTWLAEEHDRHLVERRFRHASGRWLHTQVSAALVRDEDGRPLHLIVQIVDLTARRALEEELRTAAVEDPLTGLANRRSLAEHLVPAQRRRDREGGDIGLVYIDLDGFKSVNDTFGHDAGDRVLIEAGWRLVAETREIDTVCRLGGDEFVILCAPVDGGPGLCDLVTRIGSMAPIRVVVEDRSVEVGGSVGAILVGCDEDLDEALRRADAEMYRAKSRRGPTPSAGLRTFGST